MGSRCGTHRGERVDGDGVATKILKPRGKCFYCQMEDYWKRDC